jgi:hypothetical protein
MSILAASSETEGKEGPEAGAGADAGGAGAGAGAEAGEEGEEEEEEKEEGGMNARTVEEDAVVDDDDDLSGSLREKGEKEEKYLELLRVRGIAAIATTFTRVDCVFVPAMDLKP